MSIRSFFAALLLFFSVALSCQRGPVPARLETNYAPLNEKLATTVTADENAISPQEAKALDAPVYLDAREVTEYEVSHLPGALLVGYDKPDFSVLADIDKQRPVVVYCTIGYRSERMAKKLREQGFSNVKNLYGSIYAWSLAGFPLEDATGQTTKKVHTYNKKWGSYFPGEEKVY